MKQNEFQKSLRFYSKTREESIEKLIAGSKDKFMYIDDYLISPSENCESNKPKLEESIKYLLLDLRSALDYMAMDISNKVKSVNPRRVGFPYGRTKEDFGSMIAQRLPGLMALRPDIFDLIESIQPHKCGSNWLFNLCSITNQFKHNDLIEFKRIKKYTSYLVKIEGELLPELKPRYPYLNIAVNENSELCKVRRTDCHTLVLENQTNGCLKEVVPVGPFLQESINGVNDFKNRLYTVLDKVSE